MERRDTNRLTDSDDEKELQKSLLEPINTSPSETIKEEVEELLIQPHQNSNRTSSKTNSNNNTFSHKYKNWIEHSRWYFWLQVALTLLASSISLFLNLFTNYFAGDTYPPSTKVIFQWVIASIYLLLVFVICFDTVFRIILLGSAFFYKKSDGIQYRNVLDSIIILADLIADLYIFAICIIYMVIREDDPVFFPNKSCLRFCTIDSYMTGLGILFVLRLLVFLTYDERLATVMKGVRNAFVSIFMVFLFMLIVVYACGVFAYIIRFQLDCGKEAEWCNQYFKSGLHSFVTFFQIMSGDSWVDVLRKSWSVFGGWTVPLLIIFYCFSAYLMLNIIAAILIDSIMNTSQTGISMRKGLQREDTRIHELERKIEKQQEVLDSILDVLRKMEQK